MKATFNNTVNILVKAYLNDTLEHSNCYACAVGNIVAESTNKHFIRPDIRLPFYGYRLLCWDGCEYPAFGGATGGWGQVFSTDEYEKTQEIDMKFYANEAKTQIDSTGYSVDELAKIEFAFETCEYHENKDKRMFSGLMAVVDVLAEIHGISLEQKAEAKAMFVK